MFVCARLCCVFACVFACVVCLCCVVSSDEWAGTFEHILTRTTPRTDCPTNLPDPPLQAPLLEAWRLPNDGNAELSGFQRELLALASGINGEVPPAEDFLITEAEAVRRVGMGIWVGMGIGMV